MENQVKKLSSIELCHLSKMLGKLLELLVSIGLILEMKAGVLKYKIQLDLHKATNST